MNFPKPEELSTHQILFTSLVFYTSVVLNPFEELNSVSFVWVGSKGPSAGGTGHVVTLVSRSVTNTSVVFIMVVF